MSLQSIIGHLDSRTKFILSVMAVGIALLIADSFWFKGWVSASVWGYSLSAIYGLYGIVKKDKVVLQLWVFALFAGFTELVADHYLVAYTATLVYPQNEPMIWSSPLYMPFSWLAVLIQIGYIGWWISFRTGKLKASIILLILAAILIPLYEHWAINAGWWSYRNTKMIWDVPYYISLAEGLLVLSIPFLLRKVTESRWGLIAFLGFIQGLIMLIASVIAFTLLG